MADIDNKRDLEKVLKSFVFSKPGKLYKRKPYNKEQHRGDNEEFFKVMFQRDMTPLSESWFQKNDSKNKIDNETRIAWAKERNEQIKNGFGTIGPFSLKDACRLREMPADIEKHFNFDKIPKDFYNAMISFNDYDIYFQYKKTVRSPAKDLAEAQKHRDYAIDNNLTIRQGDYGSSAHCYYEENHKWNIILHHHGYYTTLGKVQVENRIIFRFCFPEYYDNWFSNKPTDEKPCMLEEQTKLIKFNSFYELTFDLIKLLQMNFVKWSRNIRPIPFQDWYDNYCQYDQKTKSIKQLSYEEIDYDYFVQLYTSNGEFKPTKAIIDRIFSFDDFYDKKLTQKKLDKNSLHKHNVHTVIFKDSVHFNITKFFNMKGISIQAPKKIIVTYGFEKYCNDNDLSLQIKKDKEREEHTKKLNIYNDTFTLVFHGEHILVDKRSKDIIQYLENKTGRDFETHVIETIKPIFDKFSKVNKIYLVSFGTYHNMELAGEKHYDDEHENEHIDRNTWEEILSIYEDCLTYPDEDFLRISYGWPEKGAEIFGVKRKGKELITFVEPYSIIL